MRIRLYQKRESLYLVFKSQKGGRSPGAEFKLSVQGGLPCFVTPCRKAKTVVFKHQLFLIAFKTQENEGGGLPRVLCRSRDNEDCCSTRGCSNNRVEKEKTGTV